MELMTSSVQDEEDALNLFLIIFDSEKEKAWELAQ